MGRGKGRSSQTEQRPAKPPGKEEEVGEGSLVADTGMGDASAVTRVLLIAEDHSRWSLPDQRAGGCLSRDTSRLAPNPFPDEEKHPHLESILILPAEWRSPFPAPHLLTPTPLPKPEQRAERHQRLQILLPAANKTYLSLPSHSPYPFLGGQSRRTPWPSLSIAGSLPAVIE